MFYPGLYVGLALALEYENHSSVAEAGPQLAAWITLSGIWYRHWDFFKILPRTGRVANYCPLE